MKSMILAGQSIIVLALIFVVIGLSHRLDQVESRLAQDETTTTLDLAKIDGKVTVLEEALSVEAQAIEALNSQRQTAIINP